MSNFSEKLYELRKEKGYSQEEVADKLNVARQTISKWETGITTPDTNNLIELSKIFELSIDDLVGKNNNETENEENEKENSKKKKILLKIIIGIIIVLFITFTIIIIYRFILITKIRINLVNSQNREADFGYHYQETELKNGWASKWNFIDAYRKNDKLILKYYETPIESVVEKLEPEIVRIEYFDKEYYYDIDYETKTYKKVENSVGDFFYYNVTGLNIDSKFVMEFGELTNTIDRILFALDFNNQFNVSKMDTGRLVIQLVKNGEYNNQTTYTFMDKEEYPDMCLIKTEGKYGVIDYRAISYSWAKRDVNDEDVLLPDLTEFTLKEE